MTSKSEILGMSHSQAVYKLGRNIMWSFIKDRPCYRCGKLMTREDFSVDHKDSWQLADNPLEAFLDETNVDFSHHSCNAKATSRAHENHGTHKMYKNGCRCDQCVSFMSAYKKSIYTTEKRSARYKRTGI